MSNKPPFNPLIALWVGVLAVSTSAIFVKLTTAPASIIAVYRLLFTVLLMLPFILFHHVEELKKLDRKDLLYSTIAGVFLALHFVLWFESLNYTSVASSVVLVSLQPLFSLVGGYFLFKEQLSWKSLFGIFLALIGSFIIGWGDLQIGGMALWGDILALLGAVTVTGYFLVGQSLRKRLSVMVYTFLVYGTCTLSLLIYNVIFGYSFYPYPNQDWIMFLLLALVPTLLGHSVFNWLIKWMSATTISMSIIGEPVGSALLAYIILGEVTTLPQFIGGSIILLGIYLFMKFKDQTPAKKLEKKKKISQENVEMKGTM